LPNTRTAEKRARQEIRRSARNRAQRSRLKTAIKRVLQAESPVEAQAALKESAALLDRFASRRLIHPNKAARKKSQLARHVNGLGAGG
jgi:small subunit ribosomal protein S20